MGAKTTKLKMGFEDKTSKTINNVNPLCENRAMKEVADLLDDMTLKVAAKVSRVDETLLSDEEDVTG